MDGASAALREPAAEAGAVQREVVAQRIKQEHVGIVDGDPDRLAVHVQRFSLSHCVLPGCALLFCGLFECFQSTSAGNVALYAPIPPIERGRLLPARTCLRPRPEERASRTVNTPSTICARVSKDGAAQTFGRPHASRRIAAQPSLQKTRRLARAAMLLSMRPRAQIDHRTADFALFTPPPPARLPPPARPWRRNT